MTTRRLLPSLAMGVLLILAATSPSVAQTRGWSSGSKVGERAMAKDLIPTLSKKEAYIERYNLAAEFDGGGRVSIDFTISNMGWGDLNGASRVYLKTPGMKAPYTYSKKVARGEWKSAKDRFMLDIASTTIEAKTERQLVVRHKGKVELELTFDSLMPMWKPGRGQVNVKDGYYRFHLMTPRARVTGRAKINGTWVALTSSKKGYSDHIDTDVAPYNFAKRFARSRYYNKDLFIVWREFTLSKQYGGQSHIWLMIGYKGQIIFSDPHATLRTGKLRKDIKTGYLTPHAVQVDARQGRDRVKLIMKAKRVKKTDLLKSYGSAVRLIASTVSAPFRYEFPCSYALQMHIKGAKAQLRGDAHYTFDFVKK